MTRGYKNNNPGNIRHSSIEYMGEKRSTDNAFKAFETMAWGYRAIFVLLDSYYRKGFRTIEAMINRYAPPSENDTDKYIAFVSKGSGVGSDVQVTSTNRDIMLPIVATISHMENGIAANVKDISEGWELFIKHKP